MEAEKQPKVETGRVGTGDSGSKVKGHQWCGKNPIWLKRRRIKSRCGVCLDEERDKCRENKDQISHKNRRKRWALILEVLEAYGGRCSCCGETEPHFLSIDHIDGGGTKHRQAIGNSGDAILRFLKKRRFPKGFQILCHNCNQGRSINGGVCPHKEGAVLNVSGYKDDEELDGTPFAHPAYWRGEQHGVWGATMRIRQVLENKDDGSGVLGDERLESLRRDVLRLVKGSRDAQVV